MRSSMIGVEGVEEGRRVVISVAERGLGVAAEMMLKRLSSKAVLKVMWRMEELTSCRAWSNACSSVPSETVLLTMASLEKEAMVVMMAEVEMVVVVVEGVKR